MVSVKEKKKREEFDKLMEKYNKLGYDIASGKKGTGWMIATCDDIEGFNRRKREETGDAYLDEYSRGWEETLQFDYEVGNDLKNDLMKFLEKDIEIIPFGDLKRDMFKTKEAYYEAYEYYDELVREWSYGHSRRVRELQEECDIKLEPDDI
jgi:hypothetical protein